jgi:hypothetical protein
MLGNGVYGHITLYSVAREFADRPQEGTPICHRLLT